MLKVGHHGCSGSSSENYIKTLSPDIAVLTSRKGQIAKIPLHNLNSVNAAIYETGKYGEIIAEFTDNDIVLFSWISE